MFDTYKILLNICEVFAIFLQRLLKQICLRGAPLLHLVPAEDGSPLRHQRGDGPGHVVAGGMEGVHGVKLLTRGKKLLQLVEAAKLQQHSCKNAALLADFGVHLWA